MKRGRHALLASWLAAIVSPAFGQGNEAFALYVRPEKGHCIACHQLPVGAGAETRSDVGPRLEGARMRQLGRAALRDLIRDPQRGNPETLMPPFGRHHILDDREIERLVEFLHALP